MYGITVSHVYRPSWSWEDLKLSVFTFRLRTALHALRNTYFESLYVTFFEANGVNASENQQGERAPPRRGGLELPPTT